MSRTRGYNTYRGRGAFSFWKGAAAVVLLAVILASGGLLFLQRRLLDDQYGGNLPEANPGSEDRQTIPVTIGAPEDETEPGAEEVSETAEGGAEPQPGDNWAALKGYRCQAAPLNMAVYWDLDAIVKSGGYEAVCVTLKDEAGVLYFDAPSGLPGSRNVSRETGEALRTLTNSGLYTIARMACFHDPFAANANVELYGLRNTGGYIFYDLFEGDARSNWMDPQKPDARAYLCDLAAEIAELGFDEILLTTVGYPAVGQLDKIAYGPNPMGDNLTAFLMEVSAAVAPYGTKLSVEVNPAVAFGDGDASGMTLALAAPYVRRIYASVDTGEAAAQMSAGNARVAAVGDGSTAFVPELWFVPENLPKRFLIASAPRG